MDSLMLLKKDLKICDYEIMNLIQLKEVTLKQKIY